MILELQANVQRVSLRLVQLFFQGKSKLLLFICSVMSDSLRPHGLWFARLLCLWDFPARRLEWVAIFSSTGSSQPRDQTLVSCIGRQIIYHWATWEAQDISRMLKYLCCA